MKNTVNRTMRIVVEFIICRKGLGTEAQRPIAMAPRSPANQSTVDPEQGIFLSFFLQRLRMATRGYTEIALPIMMRISVNSVNAHDMSAIETTLTMPVMMKIIMSANEASVFVNMNAR